MEDRARYTTFTRTWWRIENGKRAPGIGRRYTHERNLTYEQALDYCRAWNATHEPGKLSRKCEFEQQ